MKKIVIILVLMACFSMVACSDDTDLYKLSEYDIEKVYTAGYQRGYSDCSYYNADKWKHIDEKYFQEFVDYMNAEYGGVTGAYIYTELYENQLIPQSLDPNDVDEPKEKFIPYESIGSDEAADE